MRIEMIKNVEQLFAELLDTTELRKVDFKESQYRLDNDTLKSNFVKDILCMANAPGEDGYILLGVREEPREVVSISHHYDSALLEALVASVVEEPIQFEYLPVTHKGKTCALIHIPTSNSRPHWPKKDFSILKKHVFYTRRAAGNREASSSEIREMFLSNIRLSDIARRKAKWSRHVVDELADMDLDDRQLALHKMLKSIAPKIGLTRCCSVFSIFASRHICTLVTSGKHKVVREYAVFMYPWTAKGNNIIAARHDARSLIAGSRGKKIRSAIKTRLRESTLIHVSYKNIYTKALESRPYHSTGYWFANEWNEPWGKVMKWEDTVPSMVNDRLVYDKKAKYEFFLPNVSSKAELKERLENLLSWVDNNIA